MVVHLGERDGGGGVGGQRVPIPLVVVALVVVCGVVGEVRDCDGQ